MPFLNNGAARLLTGEGQRSQYLSLHTGDIPTILNEVSGNGYSRASFGFSASTEPTGLGVQNSSLTRFRARGGPWGTIRSIAWRGATSSGTTAIYAYSTLSQAVTIADGQEYLVAAGDLQMFYTRAAANTAGLVASESLFTSMVINGSLVRMNLNFHSAYPNSGNVISGYPPMTAWMTRTGSSVSLSQAIAYRAISAERAAPTWWSLSLDTSANQIAIVGQVDATQTAIPAGTSFTLQTGQISLTIPDA